MLAQNFKTADELDISAAEFNTLVDVLGRLERGEIPKRLFSMEQIGAPDCGTPGCILGWARALSGQFLFPSGTRTDAVEKLFYPGFAGFEKGYGASRAQAATALRNFLTVGEVGWAEIFQPK